MKYNIDVIEHTEEIMKDYQVNSLLAKVIESKDMGIEEFLAFKNPRLVYHDFSQFSEAEPTLERIQEAIDHQEKICIYGDYDCDGILATTILVQAFEELGIHVGYHIPNRFEDGYGLNVKRVEQMAEKGYSLIITVDNGIKAYEAVERAADLGVDVIITDHHTFDEEELPEAFSIIHTKISNDYPFKEICGGFVAYKLAAALLGHQDKYLFSLAAITTVSDMMPLLDENRSLVRTGLQFMKENRYPSLEMLLGANQSYSTTSIGFIIAPKINSFGRLPDMINPNHLVKYFLKNAPRDLLVSLSSSASSINSKRQQMTNKQYAMALEEEHEKCLYYASQDVHEGIVGLIAGKYARDYERPSFVMHYDEESRLYKGSARGVEGFNIYKFFTNHEDLLEQYGGHVMAGGFSVNQENFAKLHSSLLEDIGDRDFENVENVVPITFDDISIENIESLSMLEPFGMGNEAPVFSLEEAPIEKIMTLSDGKHLKIELMGRNVKVSALYFSKGALYETLKEKKTISLVGTLDINEFRNMKNINLIIKDIL